MLNSLLAAAWNLQQRRQPGYLQLLGGLVLIAQVAHEGLGESGRPAAQHVTQLSLLLGDVREPLYSNAHAGSLGNGLLGSETRSGIESAA
jgi:hypothetical protein